MKMITRFSLYGFLKNLDFSEPFLILFYLDPDLMRPMVTTTLGWSAIGAVVVLETIGFLIINKIVTIEV